MNLELIENLIEHYIIRNNYQVNSKPVILFEKMRNSDLVKFFYEYFGNDRILENEKAEPGKIMFNTTGEKGFSLRVYSRISEVKKSLSLMNRSGGGSEINFPSKIKLHKYLPYNKSEVIDYVNFIAELGARYIDKRRTNVRIFTFESCRK